jgi:Tol biopolymer transport system component
VTVIAGHAAGRVGLRGADAGSTRSDQGASFSPDGKLIAFATEDGV